MTAHDDEWVEDEDERYLLTTRDRDIVAAAIGLLWKMIRSELLSAAQVRYVARALETLEGIPETSDDADILIELVGPRRRFGEHEIYHYWKVQVEGDLIEIGSGGCFSRPSTGSDSFTCMSWSASPGLEAHFDNYLGHLSLVDDAQPFEVEVAQLDLSGAGYRVSIEVDGEDIPGLAD